MRLPLKFLAATSLGICGVGVLVHCAWDEDQSVDIVNSCSLDRLDVANPSESTVKLYVELANDLSARAQQLQQRLTTICNTINTEAGLPTGGDLRAACNTVATAIEAAMKIPPVPDGGVAPVWVAVAWDQSACTAPAAPAVDCLKACSPAACDPLGAGCPAETRQGQCQGECTGSCVSVGMNQACLGECRGGCATPDGGAGCTGECVGRCTGATWTGRCDTGCDRTFLGDCDGTCTGTCDGAPVSAPDAGAPADAGTDGAPPADAGVQPAPGGADGNCKGICSGVCSGKASGSCGAVCRGNFSGGRCAGAGSNCIGTCNLTPQGCLTACTGICTVPQTAGNCAGTCAGACSAPLQNAQCKNPDGLTCEANPICKSVCRVRGTLAAKCDPLTSIQIQLAGNFALYEALQRHAGEFAAAANEANLLNSTSVVIAGRSLKDFKDIGASRDVARVCALSGGEAVETARRTLSTCAGAAGVLNGAKF